jgi:hypothetical protein
MRINRTLALTLVGAIAAGSSVGCTIVQKADDGAGGSDNSEAKGGSTAEGGAGGQTSGDSGGAAGETTQGGAAGNTAQGGTAQGGTAQGGTAQGGTSSSSTTATCLEGAGDIVDCSAVVPAQSCSPFSFPEEACVAGQGNLKPAVAENFGKCMTALSGSEVCDATFTYECLYKALKSACPDDTAATACETIREVCTEVTQAECVLYANGTNVSGLSNYQDCMTESSYCMPQSCAEGLSW